MHTRRNLIGSGEAFLLLAGDLVGFVAALWVTLLVRYRMIPTAELWNNHIGLFSILFFLWIVVFFVFDLYGRQRIAFRRKLFSLLLTAQIINSILAVLVFYFVPPGGIAPKRNIFINLVFSFAFVLIWRLYLSNKVYRGKSEMMLMLGSGEEAEALRSEIGGNPKYHITLANLDDFRDAARRGVDTIVFDLHSPTTQMHLPDLYHLLLDGVRCVDIRVLYEQIFDRVPLSLLREAWFVENVSGRSKMVYDRAKRAMDLMVALPLAALSLAVYPLVLLAVKFSDGGPVFITQERVGKDNRMIKIIKFRSMTANESGAMVLKSSARVTSVGRFLRLSRIDELPQLWNVIKGDLSLVGPRPELPALAAVYRKKIPYYAIRHLITPGLSGWAQIYHDEHPHHGTAVEQTREKLSYDLFYVKNRSFILDLKIALKTLKTLASFRGR